MDTDCDSWRCRRHHCHRHTDCLTAVGKLNLIDLAGSERVDKTGAGDDKKMFDEARNINMVCSVVPVLPLLGHRLDGSVYSRSFHWCSYSFND